LSRVPALEVDQEGKHWGVERLYVAGLIARS